MSFFFCLGVSQCISFESIRQAETREMWEGPEALWGNLALIRAPACGAQAALAHHGTAGIPVRQRMPLPFCHLPKLGLSGCCFYPFLGILLSFVLHSPSSACRTGIMPQHSVISFASMKL